MLEASHDTKESQALGRAPWLGGAVLTTPKPAPPRRTFSETREESFWRGFCPDLFAPTETPPLTARIIQHVTVAPMAFVTFLNLHYQLYLIHLLHTTPQGWLGHMICVPTNVALLFYGLAVFAPFSSTALPGANAGVLLLLVLCVWYAGMAAKLRNTLWGVLACAGVASLFVAGNALARFAIDPSTSAPIHWTLHPLFLMVVVSAIQACSHLFEPMVPPRANRSKRWMTMREFVWGDSEGLPVWKRVVKLMWTPIGTLWGTFDEWYSSAKLFPMFLLQAMWALGYKPEQRRQFREQIFDVVQQGNPALDWVGSGGGAFVRDLQ